jgi:hypothetical protein
MTWETEQRFNLAIWQSAAYSEAVSHVQADPPGSAFGRRPRLRG